MGKRDQVPGKALSKQRGEKEINSKQKNPPLYSPSWSAGKKDDRGHQEDRELVLC